MDKQLIRIILFILLLILLLLGYKTIRIKNGKISVIKAKRTEYKEEKKERETVISQSPKKREQYATTNKIEHTAENKSPDKFSESLNKILTLILNRDLPDYEFYAEGEKIYLQIRDQILSGEISHDELKSFFNHLLSLNTERSVTMAISLGVLSADKDIINSIYDIYLHSDPYNKGFILDILKEVHIAKDLEQILQDINKEIFDEMFTNNLTKGLLINQPNSKVIQWLQTNIATANSSYERQRWIEMLNYIGMIDQNNVDYITEIIDYLLVQNNNPSTKGIIIQLGDKVANSDTLLRVVQSINTHPTLAFKVVKIALKNLNVRSEIIDKIFYYNTFKNNESEKRMLMKALYEYYKEHGREEEFKRMLEKASQYAESY